MKLLNTLWAFIMPNMHDVGTKGSVSIGPRGVASVPTTELPPGIPAVTLDGTPCFLIAKTGQALPDICTDSQGKMYTSALEQQKEPEANVKKLITSDHQERYIWHEIEENAIEGGIDGSDEDA